MIMEKTIATRFTESSGTVTLNRPEVHNAINLQMIRELSDVFTRMKNQPAVRVIHLCASGSNFSAGADLNWMREGLYQTGSRVSEESLELANLFHSIAAAPQVVVCSVKGKVMGGANGIVAASDLVVAAEEAQFAFTEVRLGLVPATIAPYILRKAGYAKSLDWMLTGRLFTAREAFQAGLIQYLSSGPDPEKDAGEIIEGLLRNGPRAMKGIKKMVNDLSAGYIDRETRELTAQLIARYRTSEEGQEGMKAFFEKRKPFWDEKYDLS